MSAPSATTKCAYVVVDRQDCLMPEEAVRHRKGAGAYHHPFTPPPASRPTQAVRCKCHDTQGPSDPCCCERELDRLRERTREAEQRAEQAITAGTFMEMERDALRAENDSLKKVAEAFATEAERWHGHYEYEDLEMPIACPGAGECSFVDALAAYRASAALRAPANEKP